MAEKMIVCPLMLRFVCPLMLRFVCPLMLRFVCPLMLRFVCYMINSAGSQKQNIQLKHISGIETDENRVRFCRVFESVPVVVVVSVFACV